MIKNIRIRNFRDDHSNQKVPFCAAQAARQLAVRAQHAGAGNVFSVACVFACREYESWLLAGLESLRGKPLPGGRAGVRADAPPPSQDTDQFPRGAKGWLSKYTERGYKAATDQRPLTEMVSLEAIRKRNPRSFRRFEHALAEICEAFRSGKHFVSPS
jgi:hypothetical protein